VQWLKILTGNKWDREQQSAEVIPTDYIKMEIETGVTSDLLHRNRVTK